MAASREPDKDVVELRRAPEHSDPMRVPVRAFDGKGLALVDVTWGNLNPLVAATGVETVGEIELSRLAGAGAALIDTRSAESFREGTIPGALNFAHDEIGDRVDELEGVPLVLFCNGPQCPATPDAIRRLLAAGMDPGDLHYYRGGMHDWITLGLPLHRPDGGD